MIRSQRCMSLLKDYIVNIYQLGIHISTEKKGYLLNIFHILL